jgi:Na+/proline symporter
VEQYKQAQREMDQTRVRASRLVTEAGGDTGYSDTNYIFLSFVTKYLPAGLVGLIIAVIFAATMSASAGEINSLATVSMVDLYQRYFHRGASDHHYLLASRWATIFWGAYAIAFAGLGRKLGSLIVAVNVVGSLFYGSLLGVFVLAFFFPRVRGTAAFAGTLVGEAAILACFFLTDVSFLWYTVIGCAVVVATALAITYANSRPLPVDVERTA